MTRLFTAGGLWLMLIVLPANGADIDAPTMGAVSDLLGGVSADKPPPGADPQAYRRAVEALKTAGLAGVPRPPHGGDTALLDKYKQALMLGPRAAEFRDQVGAIHDAVLGGQADKIAAAIQALYQALGRPVPKDEALGKLVEAAQGVGGGEPAPTKNHNIEGEGYRIDISDSPAAGNTSVEVTLEGGAGGEPARVFFEGNATTTAKAGGAGLDRRVEAKEPCVMSQADATRLRERLNGEWTGDGATTWKIEGTGERISLTETKPSRSKLVYEGSYRLGKIDARHAIQHADDIDPVLPIEVRNQLAGMRLSFTLKLETCRDPMKLSGRWGSQHVTYGAMDKKVSRVGDPYEQPMTLARERKQYRIARLDIDYGPWEAGHFELRLNANNARDDLARAEEELARLTSNFDQARRRTDEVMRALAQADADLVAAEAALSQYAPAERDKSRKYRDLERKRDGLARRLDLLYDGIIAAIDDPGIIIPEAAFENYRYLSGQLDTAIGELNQEGRVLGFAAERERLSKATIDAHVETVRAEIALNAAKIALNSARARLDGRDVLVAQAKAKLGSAEAELNRFSATSPRIGGASAENSVKVFYESTTWDPSELLAFLNGEIAMLEPVLERAAAAREETRRAFLESNQRASEAQMRLYDGIWRSAITQGLAELGFNAADIVEKTIEAGPIGALGEGAKKVVEAAVLGPPSFYEPSIVPQLGSGERGPFANLWANVQDVFEYAAKRGVKSAVTSPTASLVVKKYIEAKSMRIYLEAIGEAVVGSDQTGYRIAGPSQAQRALEAFGKMTTAREGFGNAVRQGLFRNFAGIAKASFWETIKNVARQPQIGKLAHSMGRDFAKIAVKKALAEWLEGVPLVEFMAAEAEARVVTWVFLAASTAYWEVRDGYDARVAERREVLAQYAPQSSARIISDEALTEGDEVLIVLRDKDRNPLSAGGHKVTVKLGGKTATQVDSANLSYRVTADALAHDGRRGVVLEIRVED